MSRCQISIVCPNCHQEIFQQELISGRCPLCERGIDESPEIDLEVERLLDRYDERYRREQIENTRLVRLAKWVMGMFV